MNNLVRGSTTHTHTISKKLNIVQFYSRSYINQINKTTTHQLVIFLCQSVAIKSSIINLQTYQAPRRLLPTRHLTTWHGWCDKNSLGTNKHLQKVQRCVRWIHIHIQLYNIIHTWYIHDLLVAESPPCSLRFRVSSCCWGVGSGNQSFMGCPW